MTRTCHGDAASKHNGLSCLAVITCVLSTTTARVDPDGCQDHHNSLFRNGELKSRRTRKWALFCGCGPSMNLVDYSKAAYLERHFDVWATNQFFIHRYVTPRFMHVEFKPWSLTLWSQFLGESKNRQKYANTTIIMARASRRSEIGFRLLSRLLTPGQLFAYRKDLGELQYQAIRGCNETDGKHRPPACGPLIAKCSSSITLVLQLIALLQYEAVWFLGVDLVLRDHFWNSNPIYLAEISKFPPFVRVANATYHNVSHTHLVPFRLNSDEAHSTAKRGAHLYLHSFLAYNGMRSVNLSPYSATILSIATGTIDGLVRCSDSKLDGQHLEACVLQQDRLTASRHQ